jgi:hypothetical protein
VPRLTGCASSGPRQRLKPQDSELRGGTPPGGFGTRDSGCNSGLRPSARSAGARTPIPLFMRDRAMRGEQKVSRLPRRSQCLCSCGVARRPSAAPGEWQVRQSVTGEGEARLGTLTAPEPRRLLRRRAGSQRGPAARWVAAPRSSRARRANAQAALRPSSRDRRQASQRPVSGVAANGGESRLRAGH